MDLLEKVLRRLTDLDTRLDKLQRREAEARADAVERAAAAEQQRRYDDRQTRQERYANRQARADEVLRLWGQRAPAPRADEGSREYRLRLLKYLQDKLPPLDREVVVADDGSTASLKDLAALPLKRLDPQVLDIVGRQIEFAARHIADDRMTVPPGQVRAIRKGVPGGPDVTEFIGRRATFIDELSRPCRYVVGGTRGLQERADKLRLMHRLQHLH